ncbi:MAG: TlpA family protein disulfide reductase, partial [Bacteroidetes bacterium]|nr:TlpA family protein disulfide reductase [Bacteroidota bacterium]
EDQDTLVFDILFNENRFECNGKVVRKQGRKGYSSSIYTVWLDKKNYLPFKIYRKQGHHASIRRILKYEINKQSHIKINALGSIPDNFTIREFGRRSQLPELTGTIAPDFKLLSVSDNSISLSDYRGKVVLLEFTSIGCGPCHLAIPELRKLYDEYRNKGFEMLSIEAYLIYKMDAFQRHVDKNDIYYQFLIGNKEVTDAYQVMGVPYFIVIDQNGIIQVAKFGYTKKETIPKLKEVINDLNK